MDAKVTTTRPSLYAAIRLARLVQHFRERLKARVRTHRSSAQTTAVCQSLDSNAFTRLSRVLKSQDRQDKHYEHTGSLILSDASQSPKIEFFASLDTLDSYAAPGSLSFRKVASHDHLFLSHNIQEIISKPTVKRLSHVLDTSTLLLERLQHLHYVDGKPQWENTRDSTICDSVEVEKFAANLEHMLLYLQQAALQALILIRLSPLEAEVNHWRNHWQQQKQFNDGWFTEWPSGVRPLSTTWPWNIKPSLLVLWGVCWMFFDNLFAHVESPSEALEGNERWQELPSSQPSMTNYNLTLARTHQGSIPGGVQVQSQPPSQPGRVVGTVTSRAGLGSGIGSRTTGATLSPNSGLSAGISNGNNISRPSHSRARSVGHSPYIIPSTTPSVANYTTSNIPWPQNPGITDSRNPGYAWSSDNFASLSLEVPPNQYTTVSTYVDYNTPTSTNQTSTVWSLPPSYHSPSTGLGVGYGPAMNENYPSPQRSECSGGASPLCPSIPSNLSPIVSNHQYSPSTEHESHNDGRSNVEPPRNAKGEIYCSHQECASNSPPVFSRKCEWTKHMDKHTRPYVCALPGCEKIQGFTYSGGLLRHQREVHKQHGGPKTPRMCPHRDCKRSTGAGFSRKENLQEHLRRVHRGVGARSGEDGTKSRRPSQQLVLESPDVGLTRNSNKRRRAPEYEELHADADDEMTKLQSEVKRLKYEAAQKDDRLRTLETAVNNIIQQYRT